MIYEIPEDVLWVWNIQQTAEGVGLDTYNEMETIIMKYPEYFKWDHKYSAIPKEVHEAYRAERDFNANIQYKKYTEKANEAGFHGLLPTIRYMAAQQETIEFPKEHKSLPEMFKDLFVVGEKNRLKEIENRRVQKELWDKHYEPYGLEARFNFWGRLF